MKLSNDTARCNGHFNLKPFGTSLHPVCIDCARRTAPSNAERTPWFMGVVVDGVCEHKIKDTE